jgi:hypothetical protein
LLGVFLQTPFDWNILVGIGTVIAAFGSMGFLIVTLWQARESHYLNFIKNMDQTLAEHLEKEPKLEGHDDSIMYAYNYINICDQIMFLIKNKKIPRDFYRYYLDFFNYSITMIWWYSTIYPEDNHSLKHSWPAITNWITHGNGGNPYPTMHLPKALQNELAKKSIIPVDAEIYNQVKDRIASAKQNSST